MKVTGIILTKNEEHAIARAIKSISFCDEILVIDDYSNDETVSISEKLGAKVYQNRLESDFASQRNFAMSKASNEWILFVDADEVIPVKLSVEISEAVKNKSINGYYLKRADYLMGRLLEHGETASVSLVRLVRGKKAVWHRQVHEYCEISGATGSLVTPLKHYPHKNLRAFFDKLNFYTSIEAKLRLSGKSQFSWFELLVYPPAKFIQNYFIKRGFLDSFPGLVMAYFMSLHSLFVRIKLYKYD